MSESGKMIQDPGPESDWPQNLIHARTEVVWQNLWA